MSEGGKKKEAPNERLIVHNLSFDTTEGELADYFSQFGKVVEVDILRDPVSGHSRGFGFVSFETVEAATKANQEENEIEIGDRKIRTSFAKKRRKESKLQPGRKLYVGNLPWKLNEEELKSYFESFGEVEDAFLSVVKYAPEIDGYPQHKGFGFVTFTNEEDANKAVSSKEHSIKGRELAIRKAKPSKNERNKKRNNNKNKSKNNNSSSNTNNNGNGNENAKNSSKSENKQSNDPKKKPVVVKRKQQNGNKNSPKNDEKKTESSGNKNQENQKPKKTNNAPKKVVKKQTKGTVIKSSNKNPWKTVASGNSSSSEGFPSLKKEKKKKSKGKGESDK